MIRSANQRAMGHLIRRPTNGKPVPIPTTGATGPEMLGRVGADGRIAEVDHDTYWHFMEVLPPRWIDRDAFCYAEGLEPFWLFWKRQRRHYCRRLN